MPGTCDYQLTGRITYIQDNPPTTSKPYGSFRLRLQIPIQYIGQRLVKEHSLFVGVKYNPADTTNARFNAMATSLKNGKHIFMRGSVKPREASADGRFPASLYVDAPWRQCKIQDLPFPVRNKIYFDGEVVSIEGTRINLKYSYTNPKEKDPKEKWKDRHYQMIISPEATVDLKPHDNVFVEGRIFGIDPNGEQLTWMLADEAL